MQTKSVFLLLFFSTLSCNEKANSNGKHNRTVIHKKVIKKEPEEKNQIKDILTPEGYVRQIQPKQSFGNYLQDIQLKNSATVYHYNGTVKYNQTAQYAVLNISVGNQNLQQCADAVMRLRAEYFFAKKEYEKIIFFDNNKKQYTLTPPYTRPNFDKYLITVFGMCGTASLSKQLRKIEYNDVQIGDVLIRGGFPGHAVMVVDVAVNENGQRIILLAQSYMPAQDIHILKNPMNEILSPWYEVNNEPNIYTPEYHFTNNEWKTW